MEQRLKDAALETPDPERAFNNLRSFCETNPQSGDELESAIRPVSLIFSISQFLANFASSHPEALFDAIRRVDLPLDGKTIHASLRRAMEEASLQSFETLMNIVRTFKKKVLILISLRDILGKADIVESMDELSILADVIVQESLHVVTARMEETYGEPEQDAFSVIAVGKLGSGELNFSSDIDLLYLYQQEQGETKGVVTPHGIVKNRISNHEYYCKLGENLNKFLSANTEDGFVYRVDLRLRPEGQKGSIAISLPAYEIYYESWGRAWERAVLLRARYLAGDAALGRDFLDMVRPFVYRKYLDFNAIDEIRTMKTKIDETFKKDDIKRGYGGIREIEFFVHALQLIYGGKEPLLRERSTLKSLHHLLQKNLVGHGDFSLLSDNYKFLRRLEHRLQQLNDLQTHTLPSGDSERTALAGKMGFSDTTTFFHELEYRRMMVRRIYDSLFREGESKALEGNKEAALLLSEDLSDSELGELLAQYTLKDRPKVIRNIRHIRDGTFSFQTIRGQRLLNKILPAFLHKALQSPDPDTAMDNLQSFTTLLSSEESYLDLFAQNENLIPLLVGVFSQSNYLAKNIMKRREYLELLGREMFLKKTLTALKRELQGIISSGQSAAEQIRMFKQLETLRLGILFLEKKIDVLRLVKELSKTAEAVVSVCTDQLKETGLVVIGMGKAGGRELTFDSDLDLVFASRRESEESHVKSAERLIRLLTSYTKDGIAYRVDARLRPDGTRGGLVSSLDALRNYYSGSAHPWEFQALLKARPIGGDRIAGRRFMEMREELLRVKGRSVSPASIRTMRERIMRELSRERDGYDIKLGPGGLEELEFTIQYLQLANGHRFQGLFVQGTLDAIKRLAHAGIMDKAEADLMATTFLFYRTLESLLRLKRDVVLKKTGTSLTSASEFLGLGSGKELMTTVEEKRKRIREAFEKYLC
jgi:glutamate-ammonia-ligase adenylyltransferase